MHADAMTTNRVTARDRLVTTVCFAVLFHGLVILGVGWLIAAKPKISPNVVAGLLALCALGVVIGGVASAARGERVIEHHEPHVEEGHQLSPHTPAGTNSADVPSGDEEEEG